MSERVEMGIDVVAPDGTTRQGSLICGTDIAIPGIIVVDGQLCILDIEHMDKPFSERYEINGARVIYNVLPYEPPHAVMTELRSDEAG